MKKKNTTEVAANKFDIKVSAVKAAKAGAKSACASAVTTAIGSIASDLALAVIDSLKKGGK